ncbi:SatD family protein [Halostella salina]|uniref:SatD family protein n=1 Tax=Halostella salina TaxID=1547897 RepID=UPI000EF7BC40|nr:SatD family protein [Halostella salina]
MEKAFVVLGDVVGSREVADRESLQLSLQNSIEKINKRHANDIRADFSLLKGVDELGGVLTGVSPLYEVIKTIYRGTFPTGVRFAGVYDRVDVGSEQNDVAEMDGPAFHLADGLLSDLDADGRLFSLYTGDDLLDVLIGNYVNLCLMQMNEWTRREMEIVDTYERVGTQNEAAGELDVSQQRVSNVIGETNWKQFHRMESDLNDALATYDELL